MSSFFHMIDYSQSSPGYASRPKRRPTETFFSHAQELSQADLNLLDETSHAAHCIWSSAPLASPASLRETLELEFLGPLSHQNLLIPAPATSSLMFSGSSLSLGSHCQDRCINSSPGCGRHANQ